MATYDIGDTVRLSAAFANIAGTATDPTTVTLRVTSRSLTTVYTYAAGQITRASAGNYYYDLAITSDHGRWSYRWEATGAVATAEEGELYVRRSRF
jgi:hypothetical protein